MIPSDERLCSFATLSEQESSQTRQMDRGEIEVEEERRVRMKRMPVLPTEREKYENESAHVANRIQCKTEDSRKHLENKSSLPRVAMDRGFLAREHGRRSGHEYNVDTEASQRRQKPIKCPTKPQSLMRSIVCWKTFTRMPCAERCSKGDVGSDAQTFVDPVWVGRIERMMAEKSSRVFASVEVVRVRNDVREIERSAKTNDRVLPEKFGCRANSKGIVPPWVAGCVAHVLHRSEKHQNVRARSRLRKCRDALTRDDETVDPGI